MRRKSRAKQTVERLRKRVLENPDGQLTPEDRNAIIKFDDQFSIDRQKTGRAGWQHHRNKMQDLIVFAEETGVLAQTLEDGKRSKDAVDEIVTWITDQDASGYTIQGNLSSLRVFAQTVLRELPNRFQEITPSAHVDEDPAPLPTNIVEYEHLLAMLEETDSSRDCALFATEWDGGFRPQGELWTLQYKHIEFFDGYAKITLEKEGKTERHEVVINVGVPFLDQWIHEDHPVHDDPEADLGPETFIWTRQNKNTLLCYGALAERFDVAGSAAEIEVDHCPQHFRRSCASILARQTEMGLTDLMERFSWARTSDAPWHYISAHSNPTNAKVLASRGQEVEDLHDEPETAPILCPDCGEWAMRGLSECVACDVALDPEQTVLEQRACESPQKAGEKSLAEMVLDGDITAADLRTLRRLETPIKTEHDLFKNLDELIVKAEALEDAMDQQGKDVSSLLGVTGLVGWTSATVGEAAKRWTSTKHAAMTIHPGLEDYPPSRPRLAGVLLGWLAILSVAIPLLIMNSIFQDVVAGEPTAVLSAIVAAGIGLWLVHRDMPSLDEALDAAASE